MTRILLACPLFICLGGLFAARLYTRGAFLIPAFMPIVYNIGTLGGGILLGRRIGVTSLAIGTVAGAVIGMFVLPLIGAIRLGIRYRPCLDLGDPYFQKWLKTTIPLMLGVSIVTADDYFIRYFAGGTAGAISLLNYAKRLTGVPIAVLGQAIGQAAMPFFSNLANSGDWTMFRETVDRSVTRMVLAGIFSISLLESLSLSAVRLVYEHGHFTDADAHASALYFAIFVVTLIFWISQGIYARAFYATGNTFAPMLQSTIVSLLTLPVYQILMNRFGIAGLAWASDFAIVCQTLTLALLLHSRGLLYLDRIRWMEIGRAAIAAVLAWFAASTALQWIEPAQYLWAHEVGSVFVVSLVWLVAIVILSRVFRLHSATAEAMSILKKLRLT
jgi:putative peptidoglycan lipid II flippase